MEAGPNSRQLFPILGIGLQNRHISGQHVTDAVAGSEILQKFHVRVNGQ
jgi:hypothetical protein